MSIRSVFGRLLLSVSEKLKKSAKSLGITDTGQGSTTESVKSKRLIWDVIDGPFHRDDFDQDILEDILAQEDIDESYEYMVVIKMQEGDTLSQINFWLQSEEEVQDLIDHFKYNIEPLELME